MMIIILSLFIVTIPDEFLDQTPIEIFQENIKKLQKVFPRNLNVSGEILVKSPPSEEILTAYIQQGKSAETAWIDHTVGADLTERDFRYAQIKFSRLYKAQLIRADLKNADLSEAQMQGATLSEAQMQGATLSEAQMQGATLSEAQMKGTNLSLAQMQDAK